ncbi:unnamed protein product [Heligmosomoides polygyrus]|uniref:Uncharacterized protein n=1 Tax=Heligmosomoides polygyrus TaxID=6339 RepID=A0A3P8AMV7_HELPZ|nr:unnamed protein product [Heligmosomoides polygyrus]
MRWNRTCAMPKARYSATTTKHAASSQTVNMVLVNSLALVAASKRDRVVQLVALFHSSPNGINSFPYDNLYCLLDVFPVLVRGGINPFL